MSWPLVVLLYAAAMLYLAGVGFLTAVQDQRTAVRARGPARPSVRFLSERRQAAPAH